MLRDLITRYLGNTDSPVAERLLAPERPFIWDFTGRMNAGGSPAVAGGPNSPQ